MPGRLQNPHAQRLALDLAVVQALQRLFGHATFDGDISLEVEDRDFANLGAGNARLTRQRAEDVARTHLLLAPTRDPQLGNADPRPATQENSALATLEKSDEGGT